MRSDYIISDGQLEEMKRNQKLEELHDIETSRKRLVDSYQARLKIPDQRKSEL